MRRFLRSENLPVAGPLLVIVPSAFFVICSICPKLLALTYNNPRAGSKEPPPQLPPPWRPGKLIVGDSASGRNGPPKRGLCCSMNERQYASSSGVTVATSAIEKVCRANGGGLSGNGCVGEARSPGTSLDGTGRSS